MFQIARRLLSSAYTVFLFSKSDLVLVLAPMLVVGMVLSGPTDLSSFIMAFIWLELHLLAFEIGNQLSAIEEDKISKPDRPFPSGRMSLKQGDNLYLFVLASCIVASIYHGLIPVTLVYLLTILMYNEGGWSLHPLPKSPFGAIGYMCYSWGTAYIMGHHQPLSRTSVNAIIASGVIFSLTGHAQDFKDRSGDAKIGRVTVPLALPQNVARWSLLLAMFSITYALIILWQPPLLANIVLTFLAAMASVKFVANHSEDEDRKSFRWYELWLICSHMLPLFERISNGEISLPSVSNLSFAIPSLAV